MPGLVVTADRRRVVGCAWHPRFQAYHVLVHLVVGRSIVASTVANRPIDSPNLPMAGLGHGFLFDLDPSVGAGRPGVLIGETDEWLDLSDPAKPPPAALTVEAILDTPCRRPWVSGNIYFDAQIAGLPVATIVDLFYRDYLGRPADPDGLAHYCGRLRNGSLNYQTIRTILVNSQEYKSRWKPATAAPGAIFSQRIVLRAGSEIVEGPETRVSMRRLMALSGVDFITASYRQLLAEAPSDPVLWHHLGELRAGRRRRDILHELSCRPAALARNLRFLDPVEEPEVPPAVLPTMQEIAARFADLLRLPTSAFVGESYRQLLGRQPSADEAAYALRELGAGRARLDILRDLAGEPLAVARRVPAGGGTRRRRGEGEQHASRLGTTPKPSGQDPTAAAD